MGEGVVEHGNLVKLTATARMFEKVMVVNYYHSLIRYLFDGFTQIANSATAVDQGRPLLAYHQTHDRRLVVPRLMENKKIGSNLVDLEPILGSRNPFEIGIWRLGLPWGHRIALSP